MSHLICHLIGNVIVWSWYVCVCMYIVCMHYSVWTLKFILAYIHLLDRDTIGYFPFAVSGTNSFVRTFYLFYT